ncbi:hypothetical protein O181_112739 [Austropuccinia psidii MF-1]|uniref:Secreted protein n=1 Tax=Austropuccinia psidii MF-1 TaxID=1389203 RepID=A0A9Q3K4I4_9BASI|nr:hypothetical protein [Austropuccinia psidii MF-1]
MPPMLLTILTLAVPSRNASDTPLTTPALSAPPLTVLTLLRCPQDMPLMPPSTPLRPNPLSAAYHPYAQVLDP